MPPLGADEVLHNVDPIAVGKGETPPSFAFAARYETLRADRSSALGSAPYEALMGNLREYDALLRKYSVKQTEIERARRAARMCGLEFPEKRGAAAMTKNAAPKPSAQAAQPQP